MKVIHEMMMGRCKGVEKRSGDRWGVNHGWRKRSTHEGCYLQGETNDEKKRQNRDRESESFNSSPRPLFL